MDKLAKAFFVLGGPACGKGTACKAVERAGGYAHISAGELLREQHNSELSGVINQCLSEGKIVPAKITVKLLELKMHQIGFLLRPFLIDGFPRNQDNYDTWAGHMVEVMVPKVIYMKCDYEELVKRMKQRNEGREDDSIEILKKRYNTFLVETMPLLEEFRRQKMLVEVDCSKSIEETYNSFRSALRS